jgi:electron-transferring-flavoprotein dehydrogenase
MVAAEAVHDLLATDEIEAKSYQSNMEKSWVYNELKEVRNCHASFHYGLLPGLAYSAVSAFLLKGRESWTFRNQTPGLYRLCLAI